MGVSGVAVDERRAQDHRGGMWLAAVGVLAFSLTAPTTKIVLRSSSVLFASSGRALAAGVLASVVLVARRAPRPPASQRRHLTWVVACVVFGFPLFNSWGLQRVPSSHGAVVIALLPLATAGVATLIAGERPSRRYWAWSSVGLVAVLAFVVSRGGGSIHVGDLSLLGAVAAAAFGYAHGAVASRTMPGWQVICWALVFGLPGTLVLTVVGLGGSGAPNGVWPWLAFASTAAISSLLGFFAWYAGLAKAGIAQAGQLQLLQPMLSLVWAWPIVGERLGGAAVLTSLVVLVAVGIGRRSPVLHTHRVADDQGSAQPPTLIVTSPAAGS